MPKFTTAQQQAIDDKGHTLLVSAAAGSGKTTVLVERVMQQICDVTANVKADSLVIMTFTNAAAQELRARLASELDKRLLTTTDKQLIVWIKKQKLYLKRARIGTIDSFCKQLVSENFNTLNIPASINVADKAQMLELSQLAVDDAIEQMFDNSDFVNFCDTFGKSRSDKIAQDTILSISKFISCFKNKFKQLDKIQDFYQDINSIQNSIYGEFMLKQALDATDIGLQYLQKANEILLQEADLDYLCDLIKSETEILEKIKEQLENNDIQTATQIAKTYVADRFPNKRIQNENKAVVKALRDGAKDILTSLKENILICTQDEYLSDVKKISPMVNALCKATKIYEEKYLEYKLEQNILEFSDFEQMALSLLINENDEKTQLATELSNSISMVMVDEYQDTNQLQDTIYQALANDDKSNLFFVGDIKQSIYRFRQANPDIFVEKLDNYNIYNQKDYPATIILGHNFRSDVQVINAINEIFENIMTRNVGGVEYDQDQKLHTLSEAETTDKKVELHIVDTSEQEKEKDYEYVAQLIKDILEKGEMIQTKDGERRVQPGDIALLLRSANTESDNYIKQLEKLGVQGFSMADEGFLNLAEMQPVIAMLRVIDNPSLDIEMAAALASPLFVYSADDLARLKSGDVKKKLYNALTESNLQKDIDFIKNLNQLTFCAATSSPYDVFQMLMQITNYETVIGGMVNGTAVRNALRKLSEFILNYSLSGGLSGFIRYMDLAIQNSGAISQNSKTAPDGFINILSIHASKGLEFPIVIVAGIQKKFNDSDSKEQVLINDKMGVAMRLKNSTGGIYNTMPHSAIIAHIKNETRSEEMRILYVALTRAKNKLYLVAAQNNVDTKILKVAQEIYALDKVMPYCLQKTSSYLTWVLYAVMQTKSGVELYNQIGFPIPKVLDAQNNIKVVLAKSKEIQEIKQSEQFEFKCDVDETLLKNIEKGFELEQQLENQKQNQLQLPVKVSVSQIAKKELDKKILKRPAFMYSKGLTAAERGTAMHSFLQFANFENAKQNLQTEKQRLVNNLFLTIDQIKALDDEKIISFLNSDIASFINNGEKVLKEYEFLTKIDAQIVDKSAEQNQQIFLQGVADCVVINGDKAVIIDYKTDRNKTAQDFINQYATQLTLYKKAVEARLVVTVEKCIIYSIENSEVIEVM